MTETARAAVAVDALVEVLTDPAVGAALGADLRCGDADSAYRTLQLLGARSAGRAALVAHECGRKPHPTPARVAADPTRADQSGRALAEIVSRHLDALGLALPDDTLGRMRVALDELGQVQEGKVDGEVERADIAGMEA